MGEEHRLERKDFDFLLQALRQEGYVLIGPRLSDGAIVYDELESSSDLPVGLSDQQDAGKYRLEQRGDEALFGYAVGPHSWKKFLFPARVRLYQIERTADGFKTHAEGEEALRYAFIGVRSCEIAALEVQDRVFLRGPFVDPIYRSRRDAFIVSVQCGQAGGTCFCVSMGTGPEASSGFDLALTEVLDPNGHHFVVEVGTERGARVFERVPHREASSEERARAKEIVEETARRMGRRMDASDVKELLYRNYESPRWEDVARRCLACANCTLVCPTCFCSTVEDTTDLEGNRAERWKRWDSCFTMDFSYLHGGSVRSSTLSRYRQWMTHKLATWWDQFGTSGCVGCGRCITWCPVGIDITEEARAIRDLELSRAGEPEA
jgi:ferredoxin